MKTVKIIDFHTHIFPEKIAAPTIAKLEKISGIEASTNGMADDLLKSMADAGIQRSVILPVVTKPAQFDTVNRVAAMTNEKSGGVLISFGGIHPEEAYDGAEYKKKLREIRNMELPGIKIHPDYQGVMINDIRCKRIIEYAGELDLWVVTHAGWDPLSPDKVHCPPSLVKELLQEVSGKRLILAHLGGMFCWDQVEELLAGEEIYMDTSICMSTMIRPVKKRQDGMVPYVSGLVETPEEAAQRFLRIIRKHGADRILWGTDCPWEDQAYAVEMFAGLSLAEEERESICHKNAERILKI